MRCAIRSLLECTPLGLFTLKRRKKQSNFYGWYYCHPSQSNQLTEMIMEKKENNSVFENLHEWSNRMQGAREMLIKLYEDDNMILPLGLKRSEDRVYTKAIVTLLASELRNVQEYLLGTNIGFRNHVNDKKGKLISCEAYFVR